MLTNRQICLLQNLKERSSPIQKPTHYFGHNAWLIYLHMDWWLRWIKRIFNLFESIHPIIKFTMHYYNTNINFLDVPITKKTKQYCQLIFLPRTPILVNTFTISSHPDLKHPFIQKIILLRDTKVKHIRSILILRQWMCNISYHM